MEEREITMECKPYQPRKYEQIQRTVSKCQRLGIKHENPMPFPVMDERSKSYLREMHRWLHLPDLEFDEEMKKMSTFGALNQKRRGITTLLNAGIQFLSPDKPEEIYDKAKASLESPDEDEINLISNLKRLIPFFATIYVSQSNYVRCMRSAYEYGKKQVGEGLEIVAESYILFAHYDIKSKLDVFDKIVEDGSFNLE